MQSENERPTRHLEAKSFRIIFDFVGLNNQNIQDIARLAVSNSEIRSTHEISYWKISSKDQGCGIIILRGKKKWRKQQFPNFSFRFNNQFVSPSAEVFTITEFKKRKMSIEVNSDFILRDFAPASWRRRQRRKVQSPKSRSKSVDKPKPTEESDNNSSSLNSEIAQELQQHLAKNQNNDESQSQFDKQSSHRKQMSKGKSEDIVDNEVERQMSTAIGRFSYQQRRMLSLFDEQLSLTLFSQFVLLLQEKFEGNGSIGLLSESLLSSLILGNDNEVEIQIKQAGRMSQGYFMLPFFYANHVSLIIICPEFSTIFHIDSKLKFKAHITVLKPKLLGILMKFSSVCQNKGCQITNEEEMWDSIEIIECPKQPADSDSALYSLRNIHEFLSHDRIYFDFQKDYSEKALLDYQQLIQTSLLANEIVNHFENIINP